MRHFRSFLGAGALCAAVLGLYACSSTPTYNPTVVQWELDEARLKEIGMAGFSGSMLIGVT